MSAVFQEEIAFLGTESSPAFVRAPEGNGCAERFIRTLKENLLWVRTFDTVEELRQALLDFRESYNTTWLIERHGFQTPAAVRRTSFQPRHGPRSINPVSHRPGALQADRPLVAGSFGMVHIHSVQFGSQNGLSQPALGWFRSECMARPIGSAAGHERLIS